MKGTEALVTDIARVDSFQFMISLALYTRVRYHWKGSPVHG
jgi:hypothetical protein